MAVELAVGYISLVTDASRIPGEIDRALGRAGRNADRHGESIGRRMASGVGTALRVEVTAAAVSAGTVIGAALTKGFGRLTAIDDAQGKLRGLGHDAAAVQTIMDSALASVKGTAFGLGEAATVAATAVAAGIKPGEELTRHLRLVADAATIAGVGLGEMGSIFGKVATSNKIQGDVINQLSDASIPIIQLLGKELGKTGEEVVKLASDGKINFETFSKAMQAGLGGAALESGKTVRGAIANTTAALGRLGARGLQPFFSRLAGGFGGVIGILDSLTAKVGPAAERLDAVLFKKIIPQIQKMWAEFARSDAAQSLSNAFAQATGIISHLGATALAAAPAVASIAKSLAVTAGALGAGAWSVLVTAMQGVAQIASSVLVPVLGAISGLMAGNTTAVVALAAAFLAFKLIPGRMQALGAALGTMGGRAVGAASAVRGVATATGGVVRAAGVGNVAMGRFGSSIAQLGTHVPAIARMQSAFVGSAAAATRFGRAAGAAGAAMSGMRTAASGVSSALGGPWAIALIAATIAVIGIAAEVRKATAQQDAMRESTRELAIEQRKMLGEFQKTEGATSGGVLESLATQIDTVIGKNEELARSAPGAFSVFTGGFQDIKGWFSGVAQAGTDAVRAQQALADSGTAARDSFRELEMSSEEMARSLGGSEAQFDSLIAKLHGTSNGGKDAEAELRKLRDTMLRNRQIAKDTTPGFFALSAAVKTLADESATAADQLDAMKTALDVLAGKPLAAQKAMSRFNEQVRDTISLAQDWDRTEGFGAALILDSGEVDTKTANGQRLSDALEGIKDTTLAAGIAGKQLGPIFARNDDQFRTLADAAGLAESDIRAMAEAMGYVPRRIEILAALKGADGVQQQLKAIALGMEAFPEEGLVIPSELLDAETRAALEGLGVKVDELNKDEVRITANDDQVKAKLAELAALKLPDKTQKVNVVFDEAAFERDVVNINRRWHDVDPVPRADGGIDGPLPSQAKIQSPKTRLYQWAEPETGGEAFIPLAASKRSRSVGILSQVAEMFGLQVTKMAEGGVVPRGVATALAGARSATGTKYVWGGTNTGGWDCSGFVGWLQQLLQGIANPTARLYTTMSLLDGATAGLKKGLGPAGTYFQVGVNREHMAATLAGQPVESGGSHGDSRIGAPAAGANDRQFTAHFHLPNELIDGIDAAGVAARSGKQSKTDPWTEKDQLDLDQAAVAVEEAKRARDEVYADSAKTDLDRRRADLAVREAEQRLIDKQAKKDGTGKVGFAAEAPPLGARLSDDELSWEQANLAVDEAKERRNEVYADPESSDNDKRRADLGLQSAQNARDDARDKQTEQAEQKPTTVTSTIADRIKRFGADVIGIVFDAAREQLPFGLGQSRWWDIPITTTEPAKPDPENKKKPPVPTGTFPKEDLDQQLPVTLGANPRQALEPYLHQAPASIRGWLERLPINVADTGGWLKPGELALNLSNRPEPIFNSPAQMAQFMGNAELAPAAPAPDFSVNIVNPTFSDGQAAVNQARKVQERQQMRYAGRR